MENKTYRVLRLIAENYKRIKAADVTPQRHVQIVAGRNAAGKTSLLDSICAVLGGKKCVAAQPIRTGAESSQIVCVLGDEQPELLVKRVFTGNGKTALEITSAEGYKAPSPQAILDSLCASIAFDPLEFVRMAPKEQFETLRELVGLDFSELDAERKRVYDERTIVNRDIKKLQSQAAGIAVPDGTPDDEVSLESLATELKRRQSHNKANDAERAKVGTLQANERSAKASMLGSQQRLAELERELEVQRKRVAECESACQQATLMLDAHQKTVSVLEDQSVDDINQQIIQSQTVNFAVKRKQQRDAVLAEVKEMEARATAATERMHAIDCEKQEKLGSAFWPVDGLSFGDDGVLYRGVPFEQASGAEQLTVSFAMAAAMNPRLKVAIVRDASLLDEDQMKVVCDLAERYDTQVWLEVVDREAGPCGILIEDGMVVQPTQGESDESEQPFLE